MSKQHNRTTRVADMVQRELALLLQKEMSDPHLGMITVSAADISPDLRNARVYVTSLGNDVDMERVIKTLNGLSGHFRHQLAKVLTLRVVPRLKFVFDSSISRGSHLSALIDSLGADRINTVEPDKP